MIENEKRILNILAHSEALSKREIAAALGISWATVVKITKRFEQSGIITFAGRPERKNVQGIDSAVFKLTPGNPAAVGIDVGYEKTVVIVTDLCNTILYNTVIQNPPFNSITDFFLFIEKTVADTLSSCRKKYSIQGIGIGIPAFILPGERNVSGQLRSYLSAAVPLTVCVDRNIRGYTLYKRFIDNSVKNFITITIRTGIGLGIILNNTLYRGESGLAGELSHVPVSGLTGLCRCGQHGCLETGLNSSILKDDYRTLAEKLGMNREESDQISILMDLASSGNEDALQILRKRGHILAQALVPLLLILDVSKVVVAGNFGKNGKVFTDMVYASLSDMLSSRISYNIHYEELQLFDFARGAAHLFLQELYS